MTSHHCDRSDCCNCPTLLRASLHVPELCLRDLPHFGLRERNTSDSEKTTLGLRENSPRTRENNPRTPKKTTLGLADSRKQPHSDDGLEDNPPDSEKTTLGLTTRRQPSDSKTTHGLRENNPRTTGSRRNLGLRVVGGRTPKKTLGVRARSATQNLGLRARTPSASVAAVASVAPAPLPVLAVSMNEALSTLVCSSPTLYHCLAQHRPKSSWHTKKTPLTRSYSLSRRFLQRKLCAAGLQLALEVRNQNSCHSCIPRLTTGLGRPTLGEENCDLALVCEETQLSPGVKRRTLLSSCVFYFPYCIARISARLLAAARSCGDTERWLLQFIAPRFSADHIYAQRRTSRCFPASKALSHIGRETHIFTPPETLAFRTTLRAQATDTGLVAAASSGC